MQWSLVAPEELKLRPHMRRMSIFLVCCLLLLISDARGAEPAYEVGFSPNGKSLHIILDNISEARVSILVAAYSFTNNPISKALLAAHRRGVVVAVLVDQEANSEKCTAVNFLANNKIPVRLNGQYAIMHHKFMVIDGTTVQHGSFNYSAAAVNKNAENVLVLKGVPGIAAKYTEEWKRLWEEGVDVRPNY